MKTLIKKGCKQLKVLKKVKYIASIIMKIGFSVTAVGYLGFIAAMMKLIGPSLMMTAFMIGLPLMTAGAIALEYAVYREIRLKAKFRRYSQLFQTILHRYDTFEDGFDEMVSPLSYELHDSQTMEQHSMVCPSV